MILYESEPGPSPRERFPQASEALIPVEALSCGSRTASEHLSYPPHLSSFHSKNLLGDVVLGPVGELKRVKYEPVLEMLTIWCRCLQTFLLRAS